jgi:hypothetical protein
MIAVEHIGDVDDVVAHLVLVGGRARSVKAEAEVLPGVVYKRVCIGILDELSKQGLRSLRQQSRCRKR